MTDSTAQKLLRSIPAMHDLLSRPWARAFSRSLGSEAVKTIITQALEDLKGEIRQGVFCTEPIAALVELRAKNLLEARSTCTLKPVVNATGVVIHTNLGRAPLAEEALQAVWEIAGVYNTLEYSPEQGRRGGRNAHVEWLLCQLSGAEAALVVNNNAAAVLLAFSALAAGREVIVSCGELVEIGDSFRIPEILSFSGAHMIPVGCTNVTRLGDYEGAITENTAALLKVHPSNYRIAGFTRAVSREALAELAASRSLVFMEDLGSGSLSPLRLPGARQEPLVRDCLKAARLLTFSGDKVLGGPQIGVIAGSKSLIDRIKGHQLLRALRVDKMTLAAFEATLRLYLQGRQRDIPVIRMIEADTGTLRTKAQNLRQRIQRAAASVRGGGDCTLSVVETQDAVGGGAYPDDALPGYGVALHSASIPAETFARVLRIAQLPVIARVREGSVIFHVRTLLLGDEETIATSCAQA
ncbi:MAG: L-seryl-tRNA(Sec) selenium transferase, partial [Spirochaetaceae bacterium]|nr:L-seryl-tRNA(Sec) selenium transferase [Spirochaetaceae bacterium]